MGKRGVVGIHWEARSDKYSVGKRGVIGIKWGREEW